MHTIHDYVKLIANSMVTDLSPDKVDKIVNKLTQSRKYEKMLHELEGFIQEESKASWKKK